MNQVLTAKIYLSSRWLRLLSASKLIFLLFHSLLLLPLFVGLTCWVLFCNAVLGILSSFAILSLRKRELVALLYTTLTNFSTKYLVMCQVYTDVGGIR